MSGNYLIHMMNTLNNKSRVVIFAVVSEIICGLKNDLILTYYFKILQRGTFCLL